MLLGEVSFVRTLIDDDSGASTQPTLGDLDADGRPDVVIAKKKSASWRSSTPLPTE